MSANSTPMTEVEAHLATLIRHPRPRNIPSDRRAVTRLPSPDPDPPSHPRHATPTPDTSAATSAALRELTAALNQLSINQSNFASEFTAFRDDQDYRIQQLQDSLFDQGPMAPRVNETLYHDTDNAPAPAPSTTSKLRPTLPAPFSGKAVDLDNFLTMLELTFWTFPDHFDTDALQVHALATLMDGPAKPWLSRILAETGPAAHTYHSLKSRLQTAFGHPCHMEEARASITALSMRGSTTVQDYATSFRTVAVNTGWSEDVLCHFFRQGLPIYLRNLLITLPTTQSLDQLIYQAHDFYSRYQREPVATARPGGYSFRTPGPRPVFPPAHQAPAQPQQAPAQPRPAPRGPLTDTEKTRRRINNLCMYCGTAGHIAIACPLKLQRLPHAHVAMGDIDDQGNGPAQV